MQNAPPSRVRPRKAGDHLINLSLALALAVLVHGGFHFLSSENLLLIPTTAYGLAVSATLFAAGTILCRRVRRFPAFSLTPWLCVFAFTFITDIPFRWPTCFHGGIGLRHIFGASILAFIVAPYINPRSGILIWLIGACTAYLGLLEATKGNLLFSDDHPAFLYRLTQLKDHFPRIPFYNPMWNGGVEAREFFPSGILNAFFILFPLVALIDITRWYNELVVVLFFVVHPACSLLAVRVLKINAPLAPILALFSSTLWFRYQFQYGTIGFLTSIALAPLFLSLLVRLASDGASVSWRILLSLVVVTSLLILWTPAAIIIVIAGAVLVVPLARFAWSAKGLTLIFALFLCNSLWILIFIEASNVFGFVSSAQSGEKAMVPYPALGVLLSDARYMLRGTAPAILFLAIPGIILFRRQNALTARTFFVVIGALFLIGMFLAPLKPRLELGRFMVVAIYIAIIPAAYALANISKRFLSRLAGAPAIGSILLIPAITYLFTAHRTLETFSPYSPELPGLTQAIKDFNSGGRIAFSGYIQHELDGGHVTPLPLFTGVPLYASRYQHDRWDHTDFIPTQFRKEHDVGIEKFFDLYNIASIAVHDPEWLPWFSARPNLYEKVWQGRIFSMFRRRTPIKGWFYEGAGHVLDQTGAEVLLRLDSSSAVLRFNWLPFLQVEGCEQISAREVYENVNFISLEGCEIGRNISIKAQSALERILS